MTGRPRVAFALGTGRCGTFMVYELLRRDPGVAASHERNVLAECFHRYCTWYGLPVDEQAFISTKAAEIEADLRGHELSFEASAPLSFSVPTLHRAFGAKFMLFVRNPVDVVNSYLSKHWFVEEIHWGDHARAPGYHPQHVEPHHSFGRIMPMGAAYEPWSRLGRIGKLAWTWATVNRAVREALRALPEGQSMIIRLEDFDFDAYRRMTAFLGREPRLERTAFEALMGSRPNTRQDKPTILQWSARDVAEFRDQIGSAAEEFGYHLDLSDAGQGECGPTPGRSQNGVRGWRGFPGKVRRGLRAAVRSFRSEWQNPKE